MTAHMALRFAAVLVFTLLAGCSASPGNQLVAPPSSTPTALATERPEFASSSPKAQPTKSPSSGSFYKPPGWDGHSDVNCSAFDTHAHAQSFFKGTGGSTSSDRYGLDGDHDGVACETLP
jgi:hypothetical protein